ncbi:MAG: hypothetical protein ABIP94_20435 [Planctomycetota bacterium]
MAPTQPERVEKLRGMVVRGSFAMGSKSERLAVFLETDRGRFLLRRKGAPAIGDTEVERCLGKKVECDGFVVGSTLLAERIDPVE